MNISFLQYFLDDKGQQQNSPIQWAPLSWNVHPQENLWWDATEGQKKVNESIYVCEKLQDENRYTCMLPPSHKMKLMLRPITWIAKYHYLITGIYFQDIKGGSYLSFAKKQFQGILIRQWHNYKDEWLGETGHQLAIFLYE